MGQKVLVPWWFALDFVCHPKILVGPKNANDVVVRRMFLAWLAWGLPLVSRKLGWPAMPRFSVPSGNLPSNEPCGRPFQIWWCTVNVRIACGTQVVWGSPEDLPKDCCCNFPKQVSLAVPEVLAPQDQWSPCTPSSPWVWMRKWPDPACDLVWGETSPWTVKQPLAGCFLYLNQRQSENGLRFRRGLGPDV